MPRKSSKQPGATPPRKTGRRTVLVPERIKKLCEFLANGVPSKTACILAGISYPVYIKYRRLGRERANKVAIDFLTATDAAKAEHEAKLVLIIQKAAMDPRTGPDHAKYLLEKRYWQRWTNRGRMELTGKNGQPLLSKEVDVSSMTDEELQAIAAGFAAGPARKS